MALPLLSLLSSALGSAAAGGAAGEAAGGENLLSNLIGFFQNKNRRKAATNVQQQVSQQAQGQQLDLQSLLDRVKILNSRIGGF